MNIVHYEGDPYVKELKLTKTVSSIMIQQWMGTTNLSIMYCRANFSGSFNNALVT